MIQFPLFQLIEDWVKRHKPAYVAWVLIVAFLIGGGFVLLKEEETAAGLWLVVSGMVVWVVGAIFLALTREANEKDKGKS